MLKCSSVRQSCSPASGGLVCELVRAAGAPVRALFLAIATEGFWAQGAADHASGAEVGVIAPSVAAGADVRPQKNLVDSMHKTAGAMK